MRTMSGADCDVDCCGIFSASRCREDVSTRKNAAEDSRVLQSIVKASCF